MAILAPHPRVLHLFSDWKWTGPAEPIVNLCRQLRRLGYPVDLACRRAPGDYVQSLEHKARERRVEPVLDFRLNKKVNILSNWRDIRDLTEYLDREEVQILHVHTSHDHLIGSRAARRANFQPRIVRSNHRGVPLDPGFFTRFLIQGHTDGWVALTASCLSEDMANFGIARGCGVVVEGTVDLDRFNPDARFQDVRGQLGIAPDEVLFGIVARVQKHRRFDVLIPALADAIKQNPRIRGMIIGRGTNFETLAREPVRQLGLEDRILLPGYRDDDFPDYLNAFDVKMFLVPGSDGSCRAVREAMALGKPILASSRGLLPELVQDGECGLVIEDTRESLTQAILKLARSPGVRKRLGQNAREKAHREFSLDRQVRTIGELYMKLSEGL